MDCSVPDSPVLPYLPVCSDSYPLSQWCYLTISSSVTPFFCLPPFPASGSFPVSWLFTSGGQIIAATASASVLPKSIQGWFPLGLTSLISLLSKGLYAIPQFESINSVIYRKSFVMSNYFPNNIKLLFVICTVLICTLIVQRQILAPQNKLRQWQQTFSSHCIIHCHTLTVRKQTPPISLYALD